MQRLKFRFEFIGHLNGPFHTYKYGMKYIMASSPYILWVGSCERAVYGIIRILCLTICMLYITLSEVWEARMPVQSPENLTYRRRSSIWLFYAAAVVSAIAISAVGKVPSLRIPVLALAVLAAGAAILFLLRFLRSNDEREQQINYRALTFAFAGTLVFSLAIGYSQAVGFHSVSWLGIPALMVVLWSIGLVLYSWRYR